MLIVHRAERADTLAAALADVLARPLVDPFAADVVAVPSRGIERWLSQQLSTVLGATPGRVRRRLRERRAAVSRASRRSGAAGRHGDRRGCRSVGPGTGGVAVGRRRRRARRRTLAGTGLLPTLGLSPDGSPSTARFGVVRHVADLFDRYAVHRPAMIMRWAGGDDVDGRGDAVARRPRLAGHCCGGSCASASASRARRSASNRRPTAAARRTAARSICRRGSPCSGSPGWPRACCGCSTRSPSDRDVHLLLLHPSPGSVGQRGATTPPPIARRARSWRHGAAMPRDDASSRSPPASASTTRSDHHGGRVRPATLLDRLQADVRDDRRPPGGPAIDEADERFVVAADNAASRSTRARTGTPGRGAARRDPPPLRRRPDPRAPRRHRHVSGHRDVRPARPGHVRDRLRRCGGRSSRR